MVIVLYIAWILLVLLAVHHGVKAQRGLRSGIVEGLVIGYSSKAYSRASDPAAFWVNVIAGLFVAALGALAILWAFLVAVMTFADHPL